MRTLTHRLVALPSEDLESAVPALVRLVTQHEIAEEQVIYPLLEGRLAGGGSIARDRVKEHKQVEQSLRDLEASLPSERIVRASLPPLVTTLDAHLEAEESLLWMIRSCATQAEVVELGDRFAAAKVAAPTHSHPLIAHEMTKHSLPTRTLATADKAHDALRSIRGGPTGTFQDAPEASESSIDDDVRRLHREVIQFIRQLDVEGVAAPKWVMDEMVSLLSTHSSAELKVLYPAALKVVEDSFEVIAQARLDHEEIMMTLLRLQKVSMGGTEFVEEVTRLRQVLVSHMETEEQDILPALVQSLGADELRKLRRRFGSAESHGWKNPHPRAPKSALGIKLTSRAIGVVDRAVGLFYP